MAIYQEKTSPLIRAQAWTGKPCQEAKGALSPAVFPSDAPRERRVRLPLGSELGVQGGDVRPGPRWVTRDLASGALSEDANGGDSRRSQAVVGYAEPQCSV